MIEYKPSKCCTCGYSWKTGQDGSHSCSARLARELRFYKKRCELAEAFIESHAADPDLTADMCKAHSAWINFRDSLGSCGT